MLRPAWLEINLSALADNVHNLKSVLSPHQQIIAVVKANAYGHGAVPVSRVALAAGAGRLAVALVEEAQELRAAGCTSPLMCLGATPPEAAPILVDQHIEAPLTDLAGARALSEAGRAAGRPAPVHLKIDTGMHRLGVRAEEIGPFCEALLELPGLEIVGVFTHFSSSQIDPEFTLAQLASFKHAVAEAERVLGFRIPLRHVCNSGATVRYPEAWLDAVRPGALLYGIPRDRGGLYMPEMRPVLALKAKLAVIKPLSTGESVGYDRTWRAPHDTCLGLLPLGYADGYDRLLSNRGSNADRHGPGIDIVKAVGGFALPIEHSVSGKHQSRADDTGRHRDRGQHAQPFGTVGESAHRSPVASDETDGGGTRTPVPRTGGGLPFGAPALRISAAVSGAVRRA